MITFNTKNMTTLKSKIALAILAIVSFASSLSAQTGTLEMTSLGSSNLTLGPSTTPVVVNFREDITNATFGTNFKTYTTQPMVIYLQVLVLVEETLLLQEVQPNNLRQTPFMLF
jgi:uncharacterized membrane protein